MFVHPQRVRTSTKTLNTAARLESFVNTQDIPDVFCLQAISFAIIELISDLANAISDVIHAPEYVVAKVNGNRTGCMRLYRLEELSEGERVLIHVQPLMLLCDDALHRGASVADYRCARR